MMTEDQAARVANLLLAVAAAGAAYYILATPPLRRMAWQLARTTILGAAPAWLMAEVRRAWAESGVGRPRAPVDAVAAAPRGDMMGA